MGWDEVVKRHEDSQPSIDPEYWTRAFEEKPELMYKLLRDVFRVAHGRNAAEPTMESLRDLLVPQYCERPFPDAIRELLAGRSVRWLAQQMGLHHQQVQRILNGSRSILLVHDLEGSLVRIEEFARALRVHPSYFQEWRRLWILQLVDEAFTVQPDLTVQFIERLADTPPARAGRPRAREVSRG